MVPLYESLKEYLLNKFLISPLLLTVLLQACGGGSSPGISEKPVVPLDRTFSFSAKITNDCGISSPFVEVELLLQDNDWQTINTYKADENGLISFVVDSEFINYTLVAKDQQGEEAQGLNVLSFYQASSDTPAYYQARFDATLDNSSCECVTQDLKLSHRPFLEQKSVTSSLAYDNWQAIDENTTLFEGIKVCKEIDGNWPIHSFSVSGSDGNQKAIASADFKDDFSENADGVWSLSAFQVADVIELSVPHQAFETNQLIGSMTHFPASVAIEDKDLLIFDTHNYISEALYQSEASVTFNGGDFFWGSSTIKNTEQILSTVAAESFAVMANPAVPAIDVDNHSEIKASGSYDYSAVAGFPMAVISYTFTAYDPETKLLMPAKWTFYGPEKGLLAISAPLKGYEDIINANTDKKETYVQLIRSLSTNNYKDYIKYYQNESAIDMSHSFTNKLSKVEVFYKLN